MISANASLGAKNPNRVAAGQRNIRLRRLWSAEDRERQRQNALRQRPWEHATGPKTAKGKLRSAANGQHQRQPGSSRAVRDGLLDVDALIASSRDLRQMLRL